MKSGQTHQFMIAVLVALIITSNATAQQKQQESVITNETITRTAAPMLTAVKKPSTGGALEVRLWGTDQFGDELKYGKPEVFLVPAAARPETGLGLKKVERYRVGANPPLLIESVEPGAYWVGVKTSFSLTFTGLKQGENPPFFPYQFYAWDGWEEGPSIDIKKDMMYYCTWYPAWIESGRRALVVSIRIKESGDVNDRLLGLSPRRPAYTYSAPITGHNAQKVTKVLLNYGKAFVTKDSILSLTHVDGGLHHSMRGELARKERKALEQRLLAKQIPIPTLPVQALPRSTRVPQVANEARTEEPYKAPTLDSDLLPPYDTELHGQNEVRVVNANPFLVIAGLRLGKQGTDFQIPSEGRASVHVPDGRYKIYFVYSNKPEAVFQGDSFSLNDNGVQIQLIEVTDGNYSIRRVK